MNHSQFLKLCRSTSTALGCIDIDSLSITNSIDVDGVNMALNPHLLKIKKIAAYFRLKN